MLKLGGNGGIHGHSFSLLHGFRRLLLYSTSSSIEDDYTRPLANYLVESLGFSEQQSLSTIAKVAQYCPGRGRQKVSDFNLASKAAPVISFLKQNGLDQSQIRKAVTSYPRILFSRVEETLIPKVKLLQELGVSSSDLAHLISVKPSLLMMDLIPAFQTLRTVLGSDDNLVRILKRSAWLNLGGTHKYLISNVALLESYGIPRKTIQKHILKGLKPFVISTDSFRNLLIRVEDKLGIPRDSAMFLYGVRLLADSNEKTIDSKCQLFKSYGWTESDVMAYIRGFPTGLSISESKIKKALEFLMNEMGFDPSYLASHPLLLGYSLEKRLVPRHRALQALKERGLIKTDYALYSVVCLSEPKFLETFIQPFKDDVPNIHEAYLNSKGSPVALPIQGRAEPQSQ